MAETRILQENDHPFLASLQYSFQSGARLFLVMEFINGGELYQHLNSVSLFARALPDSALVAQIVVVHPEILTLGFSFSRGKHSTLRRRSSTARRFSSAWRTSIAGGSYSGTSSSRMSSLHPMVT